MRMSLSQISMCWHRAVRCTTFSFQLFELTARDATRDEGCLCKDSGIGGLGGSSVSG